MPVNWVSAVMTHVVRQPAHHGKTYHLVARRPLLLCRMAQVIQEAVEAYSTLADEDDATRCDGEWFQEAFKEQLEITGPTGATIRSLTTPTRPRPRHSALSGDGRADGHAVGKIRHPGQLRQAVPAAAEARVRRSPALAAIPPVRRVAHLRGTSTARAPAWGFRSTGPAAANGNCCSRRKPLAVQHGIGRQCTATFRLNTKTFRRLRDRHLSVRGAVRGRAGGHRGQRHGAASVGVRFGGGCRCGR